MSPLWHPTDSIVRSSHVGSVLAWTQSCSSILRWPPHAMSDSETHEVHLTRLVFVILWTLLDTVLSCPVLVECDMWYEINSLLRLGSNQNWDEGHQV